MELLLAEEEQKAAKKASGKKSAPAMVKQHKSLPQLSSLDASSQDSASTTVDPARISSPHHSAAAPYSASLAKKAPPVVSSQERFGAEAYAKMAAEIAAKAAHTLLDVRGLPEEDLCQAFDHDYAQQYEQLLAEEAAEAAAESPASSSPADLPADSTGQVTGMTNTPAAVHAPASLAAGTKEKLDSLVKNRTDHAAAARFSPLESELSVCTFYPDDFIMSCSSEAQAAAVLKHCGQQNKKRGDGPPVTDPTVALVNFQSLLHQLIRCPLSEVKLLTSMAPFPPPASHLQPCIRLCINATFCMS